MKDQVYIYESPDKGKTIFRRKFGETERELMMVRRPLTDKIISWISESSLQRLRKR